MVPSTLRPGTQYSRPRRQPHFARKSVLLSAALLTLSTLSISPNAAKAQTVAGLTIGSPNTATADQGVSRPSTTPVVVHLFHDYKFEDFSPKNFTYTPPPSTGPWAKIVLVADFSINAGNQYDRTAEIYIGHANVYFGTTCEPSSTFGPSWHIQRDVTDLSPIFASTQTGEVDLGNLVNSQYTGIIQGTADLLFYPANVANPPADTPSVVFPMPDSDGGAASLGSSADSLTETFDFPKNVTRAYLDLITQSQGTDEFWYTNVPTDLASELGENGNTAFREAEIAVDGQPAGVAPVYPWIYTGGIDPFLWTPIPGVQTLNFLPYRVDLTPFAAQFNDGSPHSVGISIYNDNNYFAVTGSLLLYTDPVYKKVNGALTVNTIGDGPNPVVTSHLSQSANGVVSGPVDVTSDRDFTLAGYVITSAGRVDTQIDQKIKFSNDQHFLIAPKVYDQNIIQDTTDYIHTTVQTGSNIQVRNQLYQYPLTLHYDEQVNPQGNIAVASTVAQGDDVNREDLLNGLITFSSYLSNQVDSMDTLLFDPSFNFLGHYGQSSSQSYHYIDTAGDDYSRTITSANGVLTSVSK